MAKQREVKVGQAWAVKVSGSVVRCLVLAVEERRVLLHNCATGRQIERTPRALRRRVA